MQETNKAIRVDPRCSVFLTSLKPAELKERGRRANNNRKVLAEKMNGTIKNQVEAGIQAKLLDNLLTEFEMQLREMQEKITQICETRMAVLKEMIEEESSGNHVSNKLLSEKDRMDVVDFIIETLKNHLIKKAGKKNAYSFVSISRGVDHESISPRSHSVH
jgi:hypothetical protein